MDLTINRIVEQKPEVNLRLKKSSKIHEKRNKFGGEMKKIAFLLLTVLSLIILAEPYRPYPVIMVHG